MGNLLNLKFFFENNMKYILFFSVFFSLSITLFSQNYYWVFYKDKANTSFDPYEYFDTKAIERRENLGISLFDLSDFPLNETYVATISDYCDEYIGESRWLNASAIYTDEKRIEIISKFEFVSDIQLIDNGLTLCESKDVFAEELDTAKVYLPQIKRMEGDKFIEKGFNGKGKRIAVFDGGFPNVDTHQAFKHLRDNNQIVKTWNFPRKIENVYGWNSHGTSVLACIAGVDEDGKNIGLATGAEFLLARTEIGPEPAREEVWWAMALEWADKNGADIVNSSLGYGKERRKLKQMDGKTSVVAKAANTALEKGILVVNAAGNEGTDKSWQKIITPADSESVLAVGGVDYEGKAHIGFSSYGPSYDGRLKPNVSAYGSVYTATTKSYGQLFGTSFASPLVAGFVACAWQTKPDLSAKEMKLEIEKSADKYPYFDYANGYGIPMASYFLNESKTFAKSFEIEEHENIVEIKLLNSEEEKDLGYVFYHIRNSEGKLVFYEQVKVFSLRNSKISLPKSAFPDENSVLAVWYQGYNEEYKLKNYKEYVDNDFNPSYVGTRSRRSQKPGQEKYSKFGANNCFYIEPFIRKGSVFGDKSDNYDMSSAGNFTFGIRYKQKIVNAFSLGLNFSYSKSKVHLNDFSDFVNNNRVSLISYKENFELKAFTGEFYGRIRFVAAGQSGLGLHLDVGAYADCVFSTNFRLKYKTIDTKVKSLEKYSINDNLQYGLAAKFGYGMFSVYYKYALSELSVKNQYVLPNMEAGVEISIPLGIIF